MIYIYIYISTIFYDFIIFRFDALKKKRKKGKKKDKKKIGNPMSL